MSKMIITLEQVFQVLGQETHFIHDRAYAVDGCATDHYWWRAGDGCTIIGVFQHPTEQPTIVLAHNSDLECTEDVPLSHLSEVVCTAVFTTGLASADRRLTNASQGASGHTPAQQH